MIRMIFAGLLGGLIGVALYTYVLILVGVTDLQSMGEALGLPNATPYLEQGWQWLASLYDTGKHALAVVFVIAALLLGVAIGWPTKLPETSRA